MFGSDISTSDLGSRPSVLSAINTSSLSRSPGQSRGGSESYLNSNASADNRVGSNQAATSPSGRDSSKLTSDHGHQPNHALSSTNQAGVKLGDPEQFLNEQTEKMTARDSRFRKVLDEMDSATNSNGGVRGTPPREFQGWISVASIEASLPDVPGVAIARPPVENNDSASKDSEPAKSRKLDMIV